MSRKVHITKKENDTEEVGIQLRSDSPAPLDKRIKADRNAKDLVAHIEGNDFKFNLGVYASDPVNGFDEAWINNTEQKLKWRVGAVVHEMDIPDPSSFSNLKDAKGFIDYLLGIENGIVRNEALVAPSALYDIFKGSKKGAVYTNARPVDSALRNDDTDVVGGYELEQSQTMPINHAEGIVTFEAQGLKPVSMIDNNNGTHDVVFKGNVSHLVSNGKPFFVYEEDTKIISNENEKSSIELNGKSKAVENIESYPLLSDDGSPQKIDIVSYSYNVGSDETTIVFNDFNKDLSLGFSGLDLEKKVRFLPIPFDVSLGGNGLSGVMTQADITELHALNEYPETEKDGVATHNIYNKIRSNTVFESCNYLFWKHSPNKQYYMILARFGQQSSGDHWYVWYSRDGLASIQMVDDFFIQSEREPSTASWEYTTREMMGDMYASHNIRDVDFHMTNTGKFVFNIAFWDSQYTRWNRTLYFGRICESEFIIRQPAGNNVSSNGWASNIAFESSDIHSYYSGGSAMDWESNLYAIEVSRGNEDAWVQFWYIDFDGLKTERSGHLFHPYRGLDYHQHHWSSVIFWDDFEGERMLFVAHRHANNHYYAHKYRRERVIEVFRDTYDFNLVDLNWNDPGSIHSNAFCGASYEGGVRGTHSSWMHEIAAGTAVQEWKMSDDKVLVCLGTDNVDNYAFMSLLNFGRTHGGIRADWDLDFDLEPDAGIHSINRLDFDSTPVYGAINFSFTGDVSTTYTMPVTSAFGVDGNLNADEMETWLVANVPWLKEKELKITGDILTGFQFEFLHLPEGVTVSTASYTGSLGPLRSYEGTTALDDDFEGVATPPSSGPQLLANPAFSININNWTDSSSGTGSISHTTSYGGALSLNSGGNYSANRADAISETISLLANQQYTLEVVVEEQNTVGSLGARIIDANTLITLSDIGVSTAGTYFVSYTPTVNQDIKIRLGTDGNSGGANTIIIGQATFNATDDEVLGWRKEGSSVGQPNCFIGQETVGSEKSLRIHDDHTGGYFNATKDFVFESGEEYLLEFELDRYQKDNFTTSTHIFHLGYQSSGLNADGYMPSFILRPAVAWETGIKYQYIFTATATDGRLQFGTGSSPSYTSDILVKYAKISKLQDVVETHSVVQAGAVATGGEMTIKADYHRKDSFNTSAQIATATTTSIPAGSTAISIQNRLNALTAVSSNQQLWPWEYNDARKFSRMEDFCTFVVRPQYSIDRNTLADQYFTIDLSVGDVDYDFDVKIVRVSDGATLWSYSQSYLANSGKHQIDVPVDKFEAGSKILFNSYVETAKDYPKATVTYKYKLQFNGDGGVYVTGDWANGFKIENIKPSDVRYSLASNTLVNGGITPVNEILTQNVAGSEPVYLKYDNDPHLFVGGSVDGSTSGDATWDFKPTNHKWHDGLSIRLRHWCFESDYNLGVSRRAGYRDGRSYIRGKSMIMATDWRFDEWSGNEPNYPLIVKIPDYTESRGIQWERRVGTKYDLFLRNDNTAPSTRNGRRWAQKISVPDLGYSDNFFPLRTVAIQIRKNWSIMPGYFSNDAYVRIRFLGQIGGFPNDSDVIAESITKLPLSDIPVHQNGAGIENRQSIPFIFDNVKLTPAQEVFMVIELVGFDVESVTNNNFVLDIEGTANASGTAYREVSNVWTSEAYDVNFIMHDSYLIMPYYNHAGIGYNKTIRMQNEPYRQVINGLNDATIGVVGDETSKKYIGTYTSKGYVMFNNSTVFSQWNGGAKTWAFEIDDENIASPEHPPIIKDPEVLGVEDKDAHDDYLIFAHAFGYTPDGIRGLGLDQNGKPLKQSFSANLDNDDFYYNRETHYGGFEITSTNAHGHRLQKYMEPIADNTLHNGEDDDFRYGRFVRAEAGGHKMFINHHSIDIAPYTRDFAIEFEFKPAFYDVDNTVNSMIMGSDNLFYIFLRRETTSAGSHARWGIVGYNYIYNHSITTEEPVQPEVYQRVRITRDISGYKFFINYTSHDENAWTPLTIDLEYGYPASVDPNHEPYKLGGNNVPVGSESELYDHFAILGWTNNASHDMRGKLGYLKMVVGNSEFAYPALDNLFNHKQPSLIAPQNKGDHVLMLQSHNIGQYNGTSTRASAKAELVLTRHSSHAPARSNTPKFAIKIDQSVEAGRKKAIKFVSRREDVTDPAKISGYFIEYYRK